MGYQYSMVQIPQNIVVKQKGVSVNEAAGVYLENLVNETAGEGWEFYRIDPLTVTIPQGCLGFGSPQVVHHNVVTFRKQA